MIALLAVALLAAPAFGAGNCLQDEYTAAGQSQTLGCTANDVRVAKVINVRDLNGNNVTTCTPGPFPFIADFLVTTTSSSSRSNIGLYFSDKDVHDQPTALTGTCEDNIISQPHTCSPVTINGNTITPTAQCGSSHYDELDPQTTKISGKVVPTPDNCGDTSSNDPAVCLDSNNHVVACTAAQLASCTTANSCFPATQIVTVELPNFQCPSDVPSGTQLSLPNCTSWQVPGSTIECFSDPNQGWPYQTSAIPGSPSKCNCATIPLGITVQNPGVTVQKNCNLGDTSGTTLTKCDFGSTVEGGDVTYTATITNQSNFGDAIVDQICDNRYGTISDDGQVSSACAAGSLCTSLCTGVDTPYKGCTGSGTGTPVAGTTCFIKSGTDTCTTPLTVNGSPASCSFTVTQGESLDITDTIKVSGHGSSSGSFGPTASNSVEVISGEAPSTATITKGTLGNQGACATMRFDVDVENTGSPDETITLSALTDSVFGDVTKYSSTNTGGNIILGTNCGLASGAGTLNGVTVTGYPGGTFGTIAAGSGYKCAFDAQFCSTSLDSGGCFSNTDKVTGTITDDGEGNAVTVTATGITVKECIQAQ